MKLLVCDPTIRYSTEQCLEHEYLSDLHNPKSRIFQTIAEPFNIAFEYEAAINTIFGVRRNDVFSVLFNVRRFPVRHAIPRALVTLRTIEVIFVTSFYLASLKKNRMKRKKQRKEKRN